MNRTGKGYFKKGNPGARRGAKHKNTLLKDILFASLEKNKKQAVQMINDMYKDKSDFKWLMGLIGSLSPKEIDATGFDVKIVNHIPRANGIS